MDRENAKGHLTAACVGLALSLGAVLVAGVVGLFTGFTETRRFLWIIPYSVDTWAGDTFYGGLSIGVCCLLWAYWALTKLSEAPPPPPPPPPPFSWIGGTTSEEEDDASDESSEEDAQQPPDEPPDDVDRMSEAEKETYYRAVLGLSGEFSRAGIQEAYKGKMKKCHPDRIPPGVDSEFRELAEKKAKTLNAAREYLLGKLSE